MIKFLAGMLPAVLFCAAATPMHATTINFDYTGVVSSPGNSYGPGSFSFADGLTTVGLSDLTAFTFDLCINGGGACFDPFTLVDLIDFSATIGGGSVTDLTLTTGGQTSPNIAIYSEKFVVTGLGALEASNIVVSSGYVADSGQVVISGPVGGQAPEPSTWTFLAGSAVLVGVWKRRPRLSTRQPAVPPIS